MEPQNRKIRWLERLGSQLPTLERDERKALLEGVAIAAALVPPLCVVGIGLTNDQPSVAMNAAILLLTNLVAIILAAASAFALLGIRGSGTDAGMLPWVQKASLVSSC
jgi:uncharacterized membrane protein